MPVDFHLPHCSRSIPRAEERKRQEEEDNERARIRLEQDRIEAEQRAIEDAKRAEEARIKRAEDEAAEKVRLQLEEERLKREAEAEEQRRKEKAARKAKEEAERRAREEAQAREAEQKAKERAERKAAEAAARAASNTGSGSGVDNAALSGAFVASEEYAGSRDGYTYRSGDQGAGYYKNPEEVEPPASRPAPAAAHQPPKRATTFAAFLHDSGTTPAAASAAPAPAPAPQASGSAAVEERIAKLKAQGPPKKNKPENRYLRKLLLALAPITKMEAWEIDGEMNVRTSASHLIVLLVPLTVVAAQTLKQHRIKTLEHLLILIGHKDYWTKLELSVMTKCAIEEALTHPRTRQLAYISLTPSSCSVVSVCVRIQKGRQRLL